MAKPKKKNLRACYVNGWIEGAVVEALIEVGDESLSGEGLNKLMSRAIELHASGSELGDVSEGMETIQGVVFPRHQEVKTLVEKKLAE